MTDTERVAYIRRQITDMPELTDEVIEDKLMEATDAVLHQRYPFGVPSEEEFTCPYQYERIMLRLAIRYINRLGIEGETAHNENGVNRSYKNAEDEDLLSKITPVAKVMR